MVKYLIVCVFALVAVAFAKPAADDVVAIVSQEQDIHPDGHYHYSWESANGIKATQDGESKLIDKEEGNVARGGFEYKGDDGQTYSISYVADENGYQPQGAHLPVAPEIPAPIARALAYLATAPPPKE